MDEYLKLYKDKNGYDAIMGWYNKLVESFDFPYTSVFVDTRFGKTHMLAVGKPDASPLILLQGVAGSAPLWRHQLSDFSKHFQTYALDIVGQPGKSDPYPPSFLNDEYSLWLSDVLDGLGLDRASFAGVSAGGWLVMRFGIKFPERVDKIVMISPTGIKRARFPINIWISNVLRKNKDANALENSLTTRSFSPENPNQEFDRQLARAMALATRHYRVDKSLAIHNEESGKIDLGKGLRTLGKLFLAERPAVMRKLQSPTLLVLGEHEMLYQSNKAAKRAQKYIPNLKVNIIQDVGHSAMYDAPEKVNPLLIEFLNN